MKRLTATAGGGTAPAAALYTKGEEIFNAVSHIAGGAFGLVYWALGLYFAGGDGLKSAAVSVFAASVIILYTMSALYHFLPYGKAKSVFRIFDHCTIFLLIAGTYTPYCLVALGASPLGYGILAAEWLLAAAGISLNAVAMHNRAVKVVSMSLYVVMGWMILIAFGALRQTLSAASFYLLLAGGITYTAGIIFYAFGKKVRYFHSVWHLFDIAGTFLHFLSVLLILA